MKKGFEGGDLISLKVDGRIFYFIVLSDTLNLKESKANRRLNVVPIFELENFDFDKAYILSNKVNNSTNGSFQSSYQISHIWAKDWKDEIEQFQLVKGYKFKNELIKVGGGGVPTSIQKLIKHYDLFRVHHHKWEDFEEHSPSIFLIKKEENSVFLKEEEVDSVKVNQVRNFKTDIKYYFDNEEFGVLAKETSHPNFIANMTSDFYFSCTEEFSPFGNDDGADLLHYLESFYKNGGKDEDLLDWLFNYIDGMGFHLSSKEYSKIINEKTINKILSEEPHFLNCLDNNLIAAAFGQIKITGNLLIELKDIAIISIKRELIINSQYDIEFVLEHNRNLSIMMDDLLKFS